MKHKGTFKLLVAALALFITCGLGTAAAFDMTGPYLSVGMSNTGGLVDDNFNVGLQFDPTGTHNFTNAPDILTAGIPFEFYTVGINGVDQLPNGFFFQPNPNYNVTSTQVAPLMASTAGVVGNGLVINQTAVVSGTSVIFNVTFSNPTSAPMTVQYARGLYAEPDLAQFNSVTTVSSISAGKVTALGPLTGVAVSIVDLTGGGVPTIQAFGSGPFNWATDLATLSIPQAAGNYGNTDSSINVYWNLGTLLPNQEGQIAFEYTVSAVPLPSALLLFAPGLLGLVGLGKRFFG